MYRHDCPFVVRKPADRLVGHENGYMSKHKQFDSPYERIYGKKLSQIELVNAQRNLEGLLGLLTRIDRRLSKEKRNEPNSLGSTDPANQTE